MKEKAGRRPHAPLATQKAPRCGAKTRNGTPCKNPRVRAPDGGYRPRCRMHGCAPGSGAPPGNKNALKHGWYCRAAVAERKELRRMMRELEKQLRQEHQNLKEGQETWNM